MVEDVLRDLAFDAGRRRNEPFMVLLEQVEVDSWLVIIIFPVDEAFGHDLDKVVIPLIIFGQQHQVAEPFLRLFLKAAAPSHIDFTADDGLDA